MGKVGGLFCFILFWFFCNLFWYFYNIVFNFARYLDVIIFIKQIFMAASLATENGFSC